MFFPILDGFWRRRCRRSGLQAQRRFARLVFEPLEARSLLTAITQITDTTAGNSFHPSISASGSLIAFESTADLTGNNADHGSEVFLYDAVSRSTTQITSSTFNSNAVTLSGDGTRLAFNSTADLTGGNSQHALVLFLYDISSKSFTQIGAGDGSAPAMNAAGTRIVFLSRANPTGGNANKNLEVFAYDSSTSRITQITTTTADVIQSDPPAISADGSRIAFRSLGNHTGENADGNTEIFVYDFGTNSFTQITKTTSCTNAAPSLSADGAHVAFESGCDITGGNADHSLEIFVADMAQGVITQVSASNDLQNYDSILPALNATGSRVAFASNADLTGGNSSHKIELMAADLPGGQITQLTHQLSPLAFDAKFPSIDGSGFQIAFQSASGFAPGSNADGNTEIFLASNKLVVNSTGDAPDVTTTDGICQTATAGECTLRAAIQQANVSPGTDAIFFNIPGAGLHTIPVLSDLPAITGPVIIDGYTQPGSKPNDLAAGDDAVPLIELDGGHTIADGEGVGGLNITGGNSTIRGLVINQFGSVGIINPASIGIRIQGAGGNTVTGNFIGTNAAGSAALGNFAGIEITSSSNNTIGGTTPDLRNIISGNQEEGGVAIQDSADGSPTNNVVLGNFIGTDITGTKAVPNAGSGVAIEGGMNNTIGGTVDGARNVISGNGLDGVDILPGFTSQTNAESKNNVVQGNFIGTDVTGIEWLGNEIDGVVLGGLTNDLHNNLIGGTAAAARNIISGNQQDGVALDGFGNFVEGNYIGLDATGAKLISTIDSGITRTGNWGNGIRVNGGSFNSIGGTDAGAGNVISGNGVNDLAGATQFNNGILIQAADNETVANPDAPPTIPTGNGIHGNLIGTDAAGKIALGNGVNGILLEGASDTTVGGFLPAARNIISGNNVFGVAIASYSINLLVPGAENVVEGNAIGTDITGTSPLPNGSFGVIIGGQASNNIVGGAFGNTIAFNLGGGVAIGDGVGDVPLANSVMGNSIFANVGLGIDLGNDGATANDSDDADSGPNNLQNFPVISYATHDAGNLKLIYNVPSATANSIYPLFVQFFLADASGQGKTYLGSDLFTQDDFTAGQKTIDIPTVAPFHVFDKIVATATDSLSATPGDGPANTSEFSPTTTIVSPWQNHNPGRLRWDVTDDTHVVADDVLTIINYINAKGSGKVPDNAANAKPFLDVDGDNSVVAADVIDVINYINAGKKLGGEAEATQTTPNDDFMAILAADVAAQAAQKRRN